MLINHERIYIIIYKNGLREKQIFQTSNYRHLRIYYRWKNNFSHERTERFVRLDLNAHVIAWLKIDPIFVRKSIFSNEKFSPNTLPSSFHPFARFPFTVFVLLHDSLHRWIIAHNMKHSRLIFSLYKQRI